MIKLYWNLNTNLVSVSRYGQPVSVSEERGPSDVTLVLLQGSPVASVLLDATEQVGLCLRNPSNLKAGYLAEPAFLTRGATAADGYTGSITTDVLLTRAEMHIDPADPVPELTALNANGVFFHLPIDSSDQHGKESVPFSWTILPSYYRANEELPPPVEQPYPSVAALNAAIARAAAAEPGLGAPAEDVSFLVSTVGKARSWLTSSAIGRALLSTANAASARVILALGNAATLDVGETSGTVADGLRARHPAQLWDDANDWQMVQTNDGELRFSNLASVIFETEQDGQSFRDGLGLGDAAGHSVGGPSGIVLGDSISTVVPPGVQVGYAGMLAGTYPFAVGRRFQVGGVGGASTNYWVGTGGGTPYATLIHPYTPAVTGDALCWAVVLVGVNDGAGTDSAATIYARIQTIRGQLKADGCKVLGCTIPIRTDASLYRPAVIGQINALLLADGPGWDAVADLAGAAGSNFATYATDGYNVHPLSATHRVMARTVAAALGYATYPGGVYAPSLSVGSSQFAPSGDGGVTFASQGSFVFNGPQVFAYNQSADAISGVSFSGGTGVFGKSTSGPGVRGISSSATAGYFTSTSGTGALIESVTGTAVLAYVYGVTAQPVIAGGYTDAGFLGDLINLQDNSYSTRFRVAKTGAVTATSYSGYGSLTIAAGGTNQNVVLSPTGTGVVTSAKTFNLTANAALQLYDASGNVSLNFSTFGNTTNAYLQSGSGYAFNVGSGGTQWQYTIAGHYQPRLDATYDIGSVSLRPRHLTLAGVLRLGTYTVATLPSATSYPGGIAYVTDASQSLSAGLGTSVAGGGGNKTKVTSDGTNWLIG